MSDNLTPDDAAPADDVVDEAGSPAPAAQRSGASQSGAAANPAASPAVTPRPAPSASAASRARRIGGRPMPFPHAETETPVAPARREPASPSAADEPASAKPVSAKKAAAAARAQAEVPAASTGRATGVDLARLQQRLDRLRWIPAIIAGVAVVAMLVLGVWQAHGLWWGKRLGDTRAEQQQQVLATAKTCAAAVLSYDYRSLDKAQQTAEACITPQFKAQYEQTFSVVRQLAPQKKASIGFEVANGGVQSVSKDGSQWVVLLYGQSSYADSTTKNNPQLDVSSPIVTLTKVDGRFLVSNLNTS